MLKHAIFIAVASTLITAGFATVSIATKDSIPGKSAESLRVKSITFAAVPVPVTDAAKRAVTTSAKVTIEGRDHPIGYHLIARSGQKFGSAVLGRLVDQKGRALKNSNGTDRISHYADFTSLLQQGGKFFSITQFESNPGAMYLTSLAKNRDGNFKAIGTRSIDFSAVGGVWAPCAGVVTPWNTHLGGEESPPDGRAVYAWKDMLRDVDKESSKMLRYFGIDRGAPGMSLDRIWAVFNPYRYGYPVEVAVDKSGETSVRKHYAMGRMSIELAYIMPDRRTVYMSDDRINGGFYMFIADKKDDLSSGRLYAAKWKQKKSGNADLDWISLGHASHDNVSKAIHQQIKFTDMFDVTDQKDGTCPQGLTAISGGECLRLKPDMAVLASRLETRRYAALRGASIEFSKSEGITFDPQSKQLFLAFATISRSMEDNKRKGKLNRKYDRGGPNHIRLPYNECGAVYSLNIGRNEKIDSDYVANSMHALISGVRKSYAKDSGYSRNKCAIEKIANPDNLTFMRGHGTLIISEDSGSGHQNDAVWAYTLKSRKLTRIQTTPYGSEATSPYWYPNLDGHGYLMSVVQHPYGESDRKFRKSPEEAGAYIGYLGPFPISD